MKHKVDDLIRAMDRLPRPEYCGQRYRVPLRPPPMVRPNYGAAVCNEKLDQIEIVAENFAENNKRWLEWAIEI